MNKEQLDHLLEAAVRTNESISDLLFIAGRPMQVEILGTLKPFSLDGSGKVLTSEEIEAMARIIIANNPRLVRDFEENGSCDCGYTLPNRCRFRANVYMQNGNYAMVMRHLRPTIPDFDALHLGSVFHEIIKEKNGIIFVTGGTGMGKTTTMAAMLNEINKTREIHIVTLEDPIEFLLTPIKATFSQRELGRDFYSFHKAVRAAMRQAPKIIFVGEIRDRETMEAALSAGETGHLVFSTLHTTSAAATINRVISMFDTGEESQVRERLAESMRYIISQRLVPAISGKRLLMTEILGSNMRSREAISLGESETRRLDDIIESGSISGWHTFEQSLCKAYEHNLITAETARLYCSNKMRMVQRLDALAARGPRKSGTSDTSLKSLGMLGMEKPGGGNA